MSAAADYELDVQWDRRDEIFVARVPEFPLLAAHGNTEQEARSALVEVLADVLDDLANSGEPIPPPGPGSRALRDAKIEIMFQNIESELDCNAPGHEPNTTAMVRELYAAVALLLKNQEEDRR